MGAIVTRQIRLRVEEHEALTKAAERGEATRYIRKALTNQLIADGFMPAPEPPPLLAKMTEPRRRRAVVAHRRRAARRKATPRRRVHR